MTTATLSELLKLSPAERIQMAQDLWDSIAVEAPDSVPITEAQRREILRRAEAHRQDPGAVIPLDEALARIERSLE